MVDSLKRGDAKVIYRQAFEEAEKEVVRRMISTGRPAADLGAGLPRAEADFSSAAP